MAKMTLKPVAAAEVEVKKALAAKESMKPVATTPEAIPAEVIQPVIGKNLPKLEDVNKPVETPEQKLDDKGQPVTEPKLDEKGNPVADEKPARKKVKEVSKPFFEKKDKIVEVKTDEIPEPLKLKFAEKDKRISELEKLALDPDVQIILEAKKSGKDIFGILKDVQGIDPATYSLEDLHKMDLQSQGIEGDDFEEAMEDFRALKPYQQKSVTNPVRKKLESDINSKKESFLSKLKEGTQANNEEQAKQVAAFTKTKQDFNKLCDDYSGKEHYSVVGTPQMVESMKNLIDSGELIPRNEDGSLDAQVLFDLAHYRLFGDLRLENLENQFFSEGVETIEKKVEARGDAGKIIRMPQGTPKQDVDVAKETFRTARPVSR